MPANSIQRVAQSYDNTPYQSLPFADTAPVHLAAIRHLFGLAGAPLASARVLELGAAAGGNLIPIAIHNPQMQCLGVDLSARQVALGKQHISALELNNIELLNLDLQRIDASFGSFDFILCHGVYSWVGKEVQAAILRICRENLSADGIALISYNTYPGWREREVLRDAMLFHTSNFADDKVEQGLGMLDFISELGAANSYYIKTIAAHNEILKTRRRDYILHEYFEEDNQPLYFVDFNQQLAQNQLAYVGDTSFASMYASNLSAAARDRLLVCAKHDQILLEQYCDFINNRSFRGSIICKAAQTEHIKRQFDDMKLADLQFSVELIEQEDASRPHQYAATFSCGDWRITTNSASSYLAAKLLAKIYPRRIKVANLANIVGKHLGAKFAIADVYDLLRKLITHGICSPCMEINLSQHIGKLAELGDKPKMQAVWRKFYQHYGYLVDASNAMIPVQGLAHELLPSLDGSNDWQQLEAQMIELSALDASLAPEEKILKIKEISEETRRAVALFAAYGFMCAKT